MSDTKDQTQSKDSIQVAIKNNPCAMCRTLGKPKCNGHGGSGGAAGASSTTTDSDDKKQLSQGTASLLNLPKFSLEKLFNGPQWVDQIAFDLGLINLLFNRSQLSLIFRGKPYLSQREQDDLDEFFEAVISEFDLFEEELQARGISVDDLHAELSNHELILKFPSEEIFDQFVQRLIDKNYLPQELAQATADQVENSEDQNNLSFFPIHFL